MRNIWWAIIYIVTYGAAMGALFIMARLFIKRAIRKDFNKK